MDSTLTTSPQLLHATYFDGKTTRAHPVQVHLSPQSLHIVGDGLEIAVPLGEVQWPERTRYGKRMAQLTAGGLVQCDDSPAWDAWCRANGLGESAVVKVQQSWRWAGATVVAFAMLMGVLYRWGLPVIAQAVVTFIPHQIDTRIGLASLQAIDGALMQASGLPVAQQVAIRTEFAKVLEAQPQGQVPLWSLVFRKSKLGPNALALPGGTMVMTDELVQLADGDTRMLMAVLAHEMGHVQQRHGMRKAVQASALGAVAGLVLGDFSTVLAAMPVLLGQAHYSRDAEREADAHAAQILAAAGISPAVMVPLFDKLQAQRKAESEKARSAEKSGNQDDPATQAQRISDSLGWLGIAFASHPADAERVAFFKGTGK
ncbi:MAG: hypothetical protein CFE44_13645 [Burkholderiales bacterium PBB4]|nr:MAG: hypothetical protein CFE44_13645 [Burkholderiales bacterium PBB4]